MRSVILALLATGCATQPQQPMSETERQVRADIAMCESMAPVYSIGGVGGGFAGGLADGTRQAQMRDAYIQRCLRGMGYRW